MARKQREDAVMDEVDGEDLSQLIAQNRIMNSVMADARGEFGRHVKRLEQQKALNLKVFNVINSLIKGKNPAGITAVKRAFDDYWEKLGLNNQGDIETFLENQPETRSPLEQAMDGDVGGKRRGRKAKEPEAAAGEANAEAPAADPPRAAKKADLARFRASLRDAETADAVNAGLERFTADFPGSSDAALEAARERLGQIGSVATTEPPAAPAASPRHLRAVH